MAPKFSVIDDLAGTQRSLVTRQQLIDARFTRSQIALLLRNRTLRPLRIGVYATLGSVREWRQEVMAAVLAGGEGAVASHASAARLWGFVHLPQDAVEVTCKSLVGLKGRGFHRTTILPDDDISCRSDIPCTTFERTLCDCTTVLSPFQLGRVLDAGLRRGDASLVRLRACAARLDSGPRRRLGVIKELLSQRDADFDPGGSASELDVLRVIRDAVLPDPIQQYPVRVDGHSYVLDFAWPEPKVFVEYNGLAFHSGASAVAHDNKRQRALVGAGWRPLVFDDSTPDRQIVRDLANALSEAPSDGAVHDLIGARLRQLMAGSGT